jgi:hypothetical protein
VVMYQNIIVCCKGHTGLRVLSAGSCLGFLHAWCFCSAMLDVRMLNVALPREHVLTVRHMPPNLLLLPRRGCYVGAWPCCASVQAAVLCKDG